MDIMSTGQLRAQSISIQVSERTKCNGHCKFCISRTTPGNNTEKVLYPKKCGFKRLKVGLNFAKTLGATHAILTGKADPTQEDYPYLCNLVTLASRYVPLVDMHTNGLSLQEHGDSRVIESLVDCGLTMITYSIASFDDVVNRAIMGIPQSPEYLIKKALDLGLLVRCSLVVNKSGAADFDGVMNYIQAAGDLGAHMVVIREIWIPEIYGDYNREVYEWNVANKVDISDIENTFIKVSEKPNKWGLAQRDPLPWGTPVFVVGGNFSNNSNHGVNVTFARCDEATRGPVIKSIVHKPDGHGYRNWDHNGDILY